MKITTTKRLFCLETVLPFDLLKFEFLTVNTTDASGLQTLICKVNADYEKIKNLLPSWFNFESLKGNSAVVMIEQEQGFTHNGVFAEILYLHHAKVCISGNLSNVEYQYKSIFVKKGINKQNLSDFIIRYLFEIETQKQKGINEISIEIFLK